MIVGYDRALFVALWIDPHDRETNLSASEVLPDYLS
jgi:hypothetical protein